MTILQTKISLNTWVKTTWTDYLQVWENPDYAKAKGYYYNQQMRIEMSPIGNDHASDHAIILIAIALFASLKEIDLNAKDNCSYRKVGYQEVQPDASFYIGNNSDVIPWGTAIIDLNQHPAPDLVIEIANSSLSDDLGMKRLLYEELGIKEYWIIDVKNVQIKAFEMIATGGSRRITGSFVLPNLAIALLEEAFQKTRTMNHSKVTAWLLSQFQK